ncbi:MAG: DUF418 domain-containing protein [Burkholderiales bacterium]|nr:MAG: DUF418 domain-containing protein [Burkholderiales bacterium]
MLGILAINIAGFAGPPVAVLSPNLPYPGTEADQWAFAIKFLFFEGKMRALFSLLFGASLVLLIERADAAGKFGELLQLRRLCWLALFGLAHFYLFWWGDILFLYAISGLVALLLRELGNRTLILAALSIFTLWHAAGVVMSYPDVVLEDRVLHGTASEDDNRSYTAFRAILQRQAEQDISDVSGGFVSQMSIRLGEDTFTPLLMLMTTMGETLPLVMIGMALMRTGFFSGEWSRRRLASVGCLGTMTGLALTGAMLAWTWPRGFPPRAMEAAYLYAGALPHLIAATGYAALLVLAAPALARIALGRWLTATGKMAFTNYLATTVVMTAIFYGWGLGWIGRFGHAWQWAFVALGWSLMMLFSVRWLAHFRRGPLEWAWRSLVEQKKLSNR